MFPLRISNNASPPWSKCSPGSLLPMQSYLPTCSASSITPWESIGRTDNRTRRTRSLGPLKSWYVLPALAGPPGEAARRFASVERGDITIFLPWLMGYTRRASARRSDPAHEATDEAKFKKAASACCHPSGVTVAARSLLAEPPGPGRDATWERVKAKFLDEV